MPKTTNEPYRISSAGDLEVIVLHEAHSLMADIISPFLYSVVGSPNDQMLSFESEAPFHLFVIRSAELWSEARHNVGVEGAPTNLSVLGGLVWLVPRLAECAAAQLYKELQALNDWLDVNDPCRIWCPDIDKELTLTAPRRHLWNVSANSLKHTFLRLQKVTKQVAGWSAAAGYEPRNEEVLHIVESLTEWLAGYCQYHASTVAQLIGNVFLALNRVIEERWEANGRSNDSRIIVHPAGTSSAYFEGLHTSVLVFHRYTTERIASLTPCTSQSLRRTYLP